MFKRSITRDRIGVGFNVEDFAIMWIAQTKFGNEQPRVAASCRDWAMEQWALITRLASAFREFIPRYRPELHYMRGPGPACARRVSAGRISHGQPSLFGIDPRAKPGGRMQVARKQGARKPVSIK
ncbi:hypothetical protein B5V02_01290 [Mesorhizobium kowhaii]|uniref:Uncharacterized protein n=1 Tax=Mesorhizobium kowhaii TaxID=1300272 RepID=A0A2W7D295_9HYPH|nr:hypothetical protein B5V02_01290 [Mesorhizobium kowhaii]